MAKKTTNRKQPQPVKEYYPYAVAKRSTPVGNAPRYDSEMGVIVCPKCGSKVSVKVSGKFMCTDIKCDWWRWIAGKEEPVGESKTQNTQMSFVW